MTRCRLLALTTLCLAVLPPNFARAEEIRAESTLSAATVYSTRATLTRRAVAEIPQGSHTLVITGLPANLDADSMRAEGSAAAAVTLGALEYKVVPAAELTVPREKELTDRLQALQDQKQGVLNQISALNAKKAFYESLGKTAAASLNEDIVKNELKPEQWDSAAGALFTGLSETIKAVQSLTIENREIDKKISQVSRELAQLRTGSRSTGQVTIPLEAARGTELTLDLSYQVWNATWRPLYDARLDTESEKLELVQYGAVSQQTGEDWENIKLTLSTAQPQRGAALPELNPMWVDFYQAFMAQKAMRSRASNMADGVLGASQEMGYAEESAGMDAAAPMALEERATFAAAEIETGGFVSEYKIPGPATVKADGSQSKLLIGTFETDNRLEIHIKPQISNEAYLVADATLKGEAPILPGEVSLFRDGAYTGKWSLPLLRPGEKQELGFGIDDQVSAERNIRKDEQSEAGLISREQTIERHFVTSVQNLHKQPVTIVLQETVPVAKNKEIRLEIIKDKTTMHYKEDKKKPGLLRWTFTLQPQQETDITLGWKVSWPQDKTLSGL